MITILIGKSASGKDTLLRKMVKEGYMDIISVTTRPKREGEVHGREYFFLSKEAFLRDVKDGTIFEYREYKTLINGSPDVWYYGSRHIDNNPYDKRVVVLDIEGAKTYIEHYGKENIGIIYLDVSDEIREERAKKRGSFDKTEWDRRAKDDAIVFSKENIDMLSLLLGKEIIVKEEKE